MQRWRRLGHVIEPSGASAWMTTHASYPTALPLEDGRVRVFFSPRDQHSRSSIASVDLRIQGGSWEPISEIAGPLLSPGPRGAFDDAGVTVSCVLAEAGMLHVYYLGWSVSVSVPFRNFIGLASGRMGEPLVRASVAPVLDRSAVDPYTLGYPWVCREEGRLRMWYGSHLAWGPAGLEMQHVIKEATSQDGVSWQRDGRVVIGIGDAPEFAVSRPCVLKDGGTWRMWYSRRAPQYSLGYAESRDGVTWDRMDDQLELTGPPDAWEQESTEYATVFDHSGDRYMLYNGDGYGRTGFGIAILDR